MASFVWTISCLFVLAVCCRGDPNAQGADNATWSCPTSWTKYKDDNPKRCVILGEDTMPTMMQAHNTCVAKNASLVVINSGKKYAFVKEIMSQYKDYKFWLGLQKFADNTKKWLTNNGTIDVQLPKELQEINWSGSSTEAVGVLTDYYENTYAKNGYFPTPARFLCERRVDCKQGWYGVNCDNECHCKGGACSTKDLKGLCPDGCEVDWMGASCNQKVKEDTWSCPLGWTKYKGGDPNSCVQLAMGMPSSSMQVAHEACGRLNASLIMVNSEKKYTFFKEMMSHHKQYKFWLGLQRFDKTYIKWLTNRGTVDADLPKAFQGIHWSGYGDLGGATTTFYGSTRAMDTSRYYSSDTYKYVCEKPVDCKKGWYGVNCDNECHCHGEPCDPKDLQGLCPHGCEVDWMGASCNQKKENAQLNYYCVNSREEGQYVHIRIHTKGVQYHNIQAVDSKGKWVDWCPNTELTFKPLPSVKYIKINMDKSSQAALKNGTCAGSILDSGYEWHIKVEEKEDFVSRNDQEFTISCGNFSDADALTLVGKTVITSNVHTSRRLEKSSEVVNLHVADAFTGAQLNKTEIGKSVVLKVQFGLGLDNDATGVLPYDCSAQSEDGSHTVKLFDDSGCPLAKSPISPFSFNKSDTTRKSLITEPFPMLGFEGASAIQFHCSYRLCFDDDFCTVDCDRETNAYSHIRRRRSIRMGDERLTLTGWVQLERFEKRTRHIRS